LLYSNPQADQQMEGLRDGLRERGYVEGQNLATSYQFAEGKPERLPEKAAALAKENPDLILAVVPLQGRSGWVLRNFLLCQF